MMFKSIIIVTLVSIAFTYESPGKPEGNSGPSFHVTKALVILSGNVTGQLIFTQPSPSAPIKIDGVLHGLEPPGPHGFHVHQFGNLSDNCNGAGSHYNPENYTHAGPTDEKRHVGDLGNIRVDDKGQAEINIADHVISLNGRHSIIGRAVVVHSKIDDLGKGNNADSLKTGNAGSRLGCGIIGIVEEAKN